MQQPRLEFSPVSTAALRKEALPSLSYRGGNGGSKRLDYLCGSHTVNKELGWQLEPSSTCIQILHFLQLSWTQSNSYRQDEGFKIWIRSHLTAYMCLAQGFPIAQR